MEPILKEGHIKNHSATKSSSQDPKKTTYQQQKPSFGDPIRETIRDVIRESLGKTQQVSGLSGLYGHKTEMEIIREAGIKVGKTPEPSKLAQMTKGSFQGSMSQGALPATGHSKGISAKDEYQVGAY